jgi:hypothetical protein
MRAGAEGGCESGGKGERPSAATLLITEQRETVGHGGEPEGKGPWGGGGLPPIMC